VVSLGMYSKIDARASSQVQEMLRFLSRASANR